MVRLDKEGALLTLRFHSPYEDSDERAYLDALHEIGRHAEPFALLTVFGGGGRLSQAGEREQALWFKATRARFAHHCRAMAIVRPGAGEAMAATFRRLWPMPLIASEDADRARSFLAHHMGEA